MKTVGDSQGLEAWWKLIHQLGEGRALGRSGCQPTKDIRPSQGRGGYQNEGRPMDPRQGGLQTSGVG